MKKTLILAVLSLAAAPAGAQTRYILRYTESAPLSSFLRANRLTAVERVPGQPIFSIIDPLNRRPAALIQSIADRHDGDVSLELDQALVLPILKLSTRQTSGEAAATLAASQGQPASFFGGTALSAALTQPAIGLLGAARSWSRHGTGAGIVAVVDTGVDGAHPFFARRVLRGLDLLDPRGTGSEMQGLPPSVLALINPTTTPLLWKPKYLSHGHAAFLQPGPRGQVQTASLPAGLGHGTMVAGAVRLAAPSASILPIRAFDQNGRGRLFHVIRAIHEAEQRRARVVNLSLNTLEFSPELERTVEEVSDRGVMLVASTGNEGRIDPASFPAAFDKVSGIASVDNRGQRSAFSNGGQSLALAAAPGEAILLPFPGGRWALGWGTSFSAPWASGLGAKLIARKPDAGGSDLQSALGHSIPTSDQNLGKGLIHFIEALDNF